MVNRKIAKTAIGRDVKEALSSYSVPVFASSITQRVIFAEAAAQGKSVHEIDPQSSAAIEVDAVKNELMEFIK